MSAKNVTFQESGWKVEKWMNRRNQHKEPIEGIKVWLLLGYPSKFWNYTPKTKLGRFPQDLPVDNFFNLHLTKNIIEHKRCRIRFYYALYTCLISDFMNNKRAIYIFWIFKYRDIGLLWSKITIVIEISLKLHLHIKYWMK